MIKLCISGLGRAGKQIAEYLWGREDVKLISTCCSTGSKKLGKDLGEIINCRDTGIIVGTPEGIIRQQGRNFPDVVIDFSTPAAAIKNAEIFSKGKINIVMGTTGFTPQEEQQLFSIVNKYNNGLIYAPNITKGVNVLMFLSEMASRLLNNYDVEIIEMHHKHKKDNPSGTAHKIRQVINNSDSGPENISISSVRAGGIVGLHKVIIAGENDKLEISHESFSRKAFAEGALHAAQFIHKKTGIYKMQDMFNFGDVLKGYFSEKQKQEQQEQQEQKQMRGRVCKKADDLMVRNIIHLKKDLEDTCV